MKPMEIDAVDTVRRIRDAQYEHIKDKSVEEQIRYFREKAAALTAQLLGKADLQGKQAPKSSPR